LAQGVLKKIDNNRKRGEIFFQTTRYQSFLSYLFLKVLFFGLVGGIGE